jgi:tetratricopeptide (TPR) repeat protein
MRPMTVRQASLAVLLLVAACGGGVRSLVSAREAEERGDLDGAIHGYRAMFDDGDRRDADLAQRIGELALRRGALPVAGEHFGLALALRPDDPDATLGLGRVAYLSGDYARAAEILQPLAASHPDLAPCHAELARVAFAADDADAAARHAERALELTPPGDASLWLLLGRSRALLGRVDLAEEALRRGIDLAPDDSAGYYYLGRLYDEINLPARAVTMLEKALQLSPSFIDAARDLGSALLHQGDAERAAEVLANAHALAPDDAGLLNNLGVAERQAGRLADARGSFERALALAEGSRAAAVNLADTCLQQGDFASASRVLVEATRRHVTVHDDVVELEKILVVQAYHEVVCARGGAFEKDAFRERLLDLRRQASLDEAEQPPSVLAAVLRDDALKTLLDEANRRCLANPK